MNQRVKAIAGGVIPFVISMIVLIGLDVIEFKNPIWKDTHQSNPTPIPPPTHTLTSQSGGGAASAQILPGTGGDVNGDGRVNVGDAVYLINYIFKFGPEPISERIYVWISQVPIDSQMMAAYELERVTDDHLLTVLNVWETDRQNAAIRRPVIVVSGEDGN